MMLTDIEILNEVLTDTAKTICSGKTIKLSEPQASDSILEISQIPDDTIVIKCDEFTEPSKVFKGTNGECKRCDYILLFTYNNKKYSLFVELKRGNKSDDHIIKQLTGGRCFLDYCRSILRHFHTVKKPLETYEPRYVCFAKTQIGKTPIKRDTPRRKIPNKSPSKFLKMTKVRRVALGELI